MSKKLSETDKEFVKKVAKDSFDMILNVEDIRKAFKMLTDNDIAPMPRMRQELFKVHSNPDSIEVGEELKELPMPDALKQRLEEHNLKVARSKEELTVEQKTVLYQKALDGDDLAKTELHEDYDKGFMKMIEETKKPITTTVEPKVDRRSKEYRDSKKL